MVVNWKFSNNISVPPLSLDQSSASMLGNLLSHFFTTKHLKKMDIDNAS